MYVGDIGHGSPDQSREVVGDVLARRVVGVPGTIVDEGGPGWGWGGGSLITLLKVGGDSVMDQAVVGDGVLPRDCEGFEV